MNQTEYSFYHLERLRPLAFYPPVLQKCLGQDWRASVVCSDEKFLHTLDQHLWSFDADSFLPHGLVKDAGADQPVVLCHGAAQCLINQPHALFFHDTEPDVLDLDFLDVNRVSFVFEGANSDSLSRARACWKRLLSREYTPVYWKQNLQGQWQKQNL